MTDFDIAEIADAISTNSEDSDILVVLHRDTGKISALVDGETEDDIADSDEYVSLPCEETYEAYSDMEEFAAQVPDGPLRDRIDDALVGRGAFRRFKNVVFNDPSEIGREWNDFQTVRQKIRAVEWMAGPWVELLTADEAERHFAELNTELDAIADRVRARVDADLAAVADLERRLWTGEGPIDSEFVILTCGDAVAVADDGRELGSVGIAALLTARREVGVPDLREVTSSRTGTDSILVRSIATLDGTDVRCTSLWRFVDRHWTLVHHQETPITE